MNELTHTKSQKFKELENKTKYNFHNLVVQDIPVDIRNYKGIGINPHDTFIGINPNDMFTNSTTTGDNYNNGFMKNNEDEVKDNQILGINRVLFFSALGGVTFIGALLLLKK